MGLGKKWSTIQDMWLCRAWVIVTGDPCIGTNQPMSIFWLRVREEFLKHVPGVDLSARTSKALQNRFSHISACIQKFRGSYDLAERQAGSGTSAEDIMTVALQAYHEQSRDNSAFDFVDCWNLLKEQPKFRHIENVILQSRAQESNSNNSEASPQQVASASQLRSPSSFTDSERPIGNKRAKREKQTDQLMSKLEGHMEKQNLLHEAQARMQSQTLNMQEKRQALIEQTCGAILSHIRRFEVPNAGGNFNQVPYQDPFHFNRPPSSHFNVNDNMGERYPRDVFYNPASNIDIHRADMRESGDTSNPTGGPIGIGLSL